VEGRQLQEWVLDALVLVLRLVLELSAFFRKNAPLRPTPSGVFEPSPVMLPKLLPLWFNLWLQTKELPLNLWLPPKELPLSLQLVKISLVQLLLPLQTKELLLPLLSGLP
jgi:hypothetical protein